MLSLRVCGVAEELRKLVGMWRDVPNFRGEFTIGSD
jgi:hypothetical protein